MGRKPKVDTSAFVPVDHPFAKIDGDLVLRQKREILAARVEAEEAQLGLARAWKAAKAAGVGDQAMKWAMQLGRMDPSEARRLYFRLGAIFEALYPGVLGSKDLFDMVEPASAGERADTDYQEIELEGFVVGKTQKKSKQDHRYEQGTASAQAYERGFQRGADATFDAAKPVEAPSSDDDEPAPHVTH